MRRKKILITGSTGFVGTELSQFLLKKDYLIIGTTRKKISEDLTNIDLVTVENISQDTDWKNILIDIDVVIHLAGRAHILKENCDNPLDQFRKDNTYSTINLAKHCADAEVKRFIFISSIGVNGSHTLNECFKSSDKPNPHSDYAISKYEAEMGLKDILKNSKTKFIILRPPLIYGPNAPGNISLLLKAIKLNLPIPFGNISNRRSFISINNLSRIIDICITNPHVLDKTFVVCDKGYISTPEFVERISKIENKQPWLIKMPNLLLKIIFKALRKNNLINSLFCNLMIDYSDTQKILDWGLQKK